MAPAVERREHIRGGVSDRSLSPDMKRRGVGRRRSPHREGSPSRQRSSSPSRTRSPQRNSRRSLDKEKQRDRDGALKHAHARGRSPVRSSSSQSPSPRTKRSRKAQNERESEKVTSREERNSRGEHKKGRERELGEKVRTSPSRSPSPHTKRLLQAQSGRESEKVIRREDERNSRDERKKGSEREFREKERNSVSRSPSPRTKRLMRAQAEREVEKVKERERGSNTSKEERDNGRHGERREAENILNEKRSTRDWKQGGSSRSSKRDRDRSVSPVEHNGRSKRGSRSPSRASRPHAHEEVSNPRGAEQSRDSNVDSVAKMKAAEESLEAKEKDKQKPSFELSGKLAEETNRVRGVTLLFNEPVDARKPDVRWRLYVFKGGEVLNEPLYVHRQSCYLFGRERRVADIPTDHPSCSKQHAIIQYRLVEKEKPDGLMSKQVRPYIMDLGSTNGTFINDNRIEPQRYYELFEKDTIKFGNSSREYVILHENSVN